MNTVSNSNGSVDSFWLITDCKVKKTAKGSTFLDLTLSDKLTEINGKLWDYNEQLHGKFESGEIVKIRGTVSQYNGQDQLTVSRIRKAVPADNIDPSELVKSAEFSGDKMLGEITVVIDNMKNEDIKNLVGAIVSDYREKLLYWPAAFKLHHAIRGGLLMHTLSVLRLAQSVASLYPFLNNDLLFAGAILHDIAKTEEFEVTDAGIASGYSVEGNLLGHLARGAMIIDEYSKKLGTDRKISVMLQHMVLSHHGEPEFGAAVRPAFAEAEILSELDRLDATIYEMSEAVSKTAPDEFSDRVWCLDNRKLYNHATAGAELKVDLIKD